MLKKFWRTLGGKAGAICVLSCIFLGVGATSALAGSAAPLTTTIQQNGLEVVTRQQGDEFFHYVVTEEGYILVQDATGLWFYVIETSDGLALGQPLGERAQRSTGRGQAILVEEQLDGESVEQLMALQQMALGVETNALQAPPATSPTEESGGALKEERIPLLLIQVDFADIKAAYTEEAWSEHFFPSRRLRLPLTTRKSPTINLPISLLIPSIMKTCIR